MIGPGLDEYSRPFSDRELLVLDLEDPVPSRTT